MIGCQKTEVVPTVEVTVATPDSRPLPEWLMLVPNTGARLALGGDTIWVFDDDRSTIH
jgi:hypothetical protein